MADLASSFAKSHDVTILVHSDTGEYQQNIDQRVSIKSLGSRLPQFLKPKTLFCLFGLIRHLQKNKPDIILTTGAQHSVILLGLSKLFRFSSKIVIRETNTISVQSHHTQSQIERLSLWAAKKLYPLAHKVIAPSEGVANDLILHIPKISDKVKTIPNPIDIEDIIEKSQHPLPNDTNITSPFILAVGRLVPQKGHADLIKAWAPLHQKQNIELVILGNGPERQKLIALATELGVVDGLHLPGFDLNPFRYMIHCSVFILSSYHEGLPNTLLQAMACGCKIVATDCPSGPREILQDGKFGKLVKIGDITAIREAIIQQLGSHEDKAEERQETVRTLYDQNKISERYLNLFKTINQ